jgi:hypothetical protein
MRGTELSARFRELADGLAGQVTETEAALARAVEARQAAVAEAAAAGSSLAAIYLPALDEVSLAAAERLTGFRGFTRMEPLKAMAREEVKLTAELTALSADPAFVQREVLIGPNGEITQRLKEARDMLEPWLADCRVFEEQEGFLELVELGYDTPAYAVRWLEPRYWRLWAAGDRICRALGLADFGDDLLPAWRRVSEPRDQWRAQAQAVMAEVEAVRGVVQRHDATQLRLSQLAAIYLDECRAVLASHLQSADAALLEGWAEEDRGRVVGVRRLASCRAKVEALGQVAEALGAELKELRAQQQRAAAKALKYGAGKKAYQEYPVGSAPADTSERLRRFGARRVRWLDNVDRVERYRSYERFDVMNNAPELWWFEMTGRRPDARLTGLRPWYDRHPDAAVAREAQEHDAATAAAMADRALDPLGDVS